METTAAGGRGGAGILGESQNPERRFEEAVWEHMDLQRPQRKALPPSRVPRGSHSPWCLHPHLGQWSSCGFCGFQTATGIVTSQAHLIPIRALRGGHLAPLYKWGMVRQEGCSNRPRWQSHCPCPALDPKCALGTPHGLNLGTHVLRQRTLNEAQLL